MARYRLTAGPDSFLWSQRGRWTPEDPNTGVEEIIAGAGDDVVVIDAGEVFGGGIWGEAGNDFIKTDRGADRLGGNDGNDTIIGGEGDDRLWGDAGDDSLVAGQGRDTLYGGEGADWLGDGAAETNPFGSTDQFWGGAGNDTIQGGRYGVDTLWGEAGNDLILSGGEEAMVAFGGEGDDRIVAGGRQSSSDPKGDVIWGGAGHDWIDGRPGGGYHRLDGGDGNDTILGDYNDTAHGGAGDDRIEGARWQWGWEGNDRLVADGYGGAELRGGTGDDTLESGDFMWGGEGRDTLYVTRGNGWGEAGDDILFGFGRSATLVGMDGNDLLIGANGAENAYLIGGRGNDTIQASARDQIFTSWFEIAAGERDVVYAPLRDVSLDFQASMASAMTFVTVSGGAAIRIDTGGGTYYEMFVAGWSVADLQASDSYF